MSPSTPILPVACHDLTVRYGATLALDRVSLAVEPGQVYALLGRNGSGKTSLVRCLLGHQKPVAGSLHLFGEAAWARRAALMQRVGVVAEEPDAPPLMTARQLGRFSAHLYARWDQASVDERLRRFRVPLDQPFGRLSRGQKAQLALALALGARPELLVLDDPTLGLDAVARHEVFDEVLADLGERGTTVVITTHDLAGIEGIADRVGILENGRLKVDAPLDDLKARYRRLSWAPVDGLSPADLAGLAPLWVRQGAVGGEALVDLNGSGLPDRLVQAHPAEFRVDALSLEELFVALVGMETEAAS
jgi:ABC-2 type transport system ATP-binding protein